MRRTSVKPWIEVDSADAVGGHRRPRISTPSPRCRCRADGAGVLYGGDDHELETELAERRECLLGELRIGLENASSSISWANSGRLSSLPGAARLKLSAPARQNAISFSCSPPELSPALL